MSRGVSSRWSSGEGKSGDTSFSCRVGSGAPTTLCFPLHAPHASFLLHPCPSAGRSPFRKFYFGPLATVTCHSCLPQSLGALIYHVLMTLRHTGLVPCCSQLAVRTKCGPEPPFLSPDLPWRQLVCQSGAEARQLGAKWSQEPVQELLKIDDSSTLWPQGTLGVSQVVLRYPPGSKNHSKVIQNSICATLSQHSNRSLTLRAVVTNRSHQTISDNMYNTGYTIHKIALYTVWVLALNRSHMRDLGAKPLPFCIMFWRTSPFLYIYKHTR